MCVAIAGASAAPTSVQARHGGHAEAAVATTTTTTSSSPPPPLGASFQSLSPSSGNITSGIALAAPTAVTRAYSNMQSSSAMATASVSNGPDIHMSLSLKAGTTVAADAPLMDAMHVAHEKHGAHDHSSEFSYDSLTPEQWPTFCTVPTAADKKANADMQDCIVSDELDIPIGADKAGWALRPSPLLNLSNVHAHAHGTDEVMITLNETRLYLRKGAVPLSYIEWDFGSGLGRLSELRRFVSDDAMQIQATWPNRSVVGASGGYWRTLGDIDYPVSWDSLREDIKWRTNEGKQEPARHTGLLVFSSVLFIMACFILLPVLLCLQAARSTLVPLFSLLFLVVLTLSLFFGRLYFALTPELYPPSVLPNLVLSFYALSLACFGVTAAKLLLLLVPLFRGRLRSWNDLHHIMRMLTQGPSPGLHERDEGYRSNLSHSTASTDATLMEQVPDSPAVHAMDRGESFVMFDQEREPDAPLLDSPASVDSGLYVPMPMHGPWERFVMRHPRVHFTLQVAYTTVSRGLVPLASTIVYVSIAIYTGSCRRGYKNVCLAHGIKGAIFFWYGILTFARYLGAFGDYGWAWNKRPTPENSMHSRASFWRRNMPSAEFVESLVIFLYGISNTWLERLGARPGDPYTVKQIQHISIAVMFWFIGLVGMALESKSVRNMLGYAVVRRHPAATPGRANEDETLAQAQPPSYSQSFNPFPSLVIGVTGVAMAAHHQDYLYEVQVHILWGEMLAAFAVLRWLTYFFLWIRPPTSTLPSRPPTEAVASFALCCGGLLFMLSNEEVSFAAMRSDYADAMAMLNLAISIVALVFCWTFCVMMIKAWAFRRDVQAWEPPARPAAQAASSTEPWIKEQPYAASDVSHKPS